MVGPKFHESPFEPLGLPVVRGGGSTKPRTWRAGGGVLKSKALGVVVKSEALGGGRCGGACSGDGDIIDPYNALKFSSSSERYPSEQEGDEGSDPKKQEFPCLALTYDTKSGVKVHALARDMADLPDMKVHAPAFNVLELSAMKLHVPAFDVADLHLSADIGEAFGIREG